MSEKVVIFLGRFVLIGQLPFVFIANQTCDDRQRAFLLALCKRSPTMLDGSQVIPESMSTVGRIHGDVVESYGIEIESADGIEKADGFVVTLNHLKSHGQFLVHQYAIEASKIPLREGYFSIKIDNEGLMQGWSRASSASKYARSPANEHSARNGQHHGTTKAIEHQASLIA